MSDTFLDSKNTTPSGSEVTLDLPIDQDDEDEESSDSDQTRVSPMRGRSVKEYDEQLTALKKENFNLKLRIYMLEEKIGSKFRLEDKDNIIRKNVEYQVEIESLRRDVAEKHELLCQAVKAMELSDAEHRRAAEASEQQLQQVQLELAQLQDAHRLLLHKQDSLLDDTTSMYTEAFDLHKHHAKCQDHLDVLNQHVQQLEQQLTEEREHSSALEAETRDVDCLQSRCENLVKEVQLREEKLRALVVELEQCGHQESQYKLRIRTMQDEMSASEADLAAVRAELQQRDEALREAHQQAEVQRRAAEDAANNRDKEQRQADNLRQAVATRDKAIAELETKLEKCKSVIRSLEAKLDSTAYENKRHRDELQTIKQQRHSPRKATVSVATAAPSPAPATTTDGSFALVKADKESLNETVIALREEVRVKSQKLTKLEEEQRKACKMIQTFISHTKTQEKEMTEVKVSLQRKELQLEELQRKRQHHTQPQTHIADKENSLEECDSTKNVSESETYQTMKLEWEKQVQGLIKLLKEKEGQMECLEKQNEMTTSTLKIRDNRIVSLEQEVEQLKSELSTANKRLEQLSSDAESATAAQDKDKQIEQLQGEVRKHTINLQGIVNTELWDKNRQIEKLENRYTDKVSHLEKQLAARDVQLAELNALDVAALREQCQALQQQLSNTPERDSEHVIAHLRTEVSRLQQARHDSLTLCSLLTTRLEELATFLDSLLKHKSVLGLLGIKQRTAIQQAIDQSLDLSKSFSVSMQHTTDIDQSLAQLSSISGLLNGDDIDTDTEHRPSLTYNSHLSRYRATDDDVTDQIHVISVLRAQIETMKQEIEVRDMELAKQHHDQLHNDTDLVEVLMDLHKSPVTKPDLVQSPAKIYQSLLAVDNQSESEAWSEPDRCVSQARMGLDADALKNTSTTSNVSRCSRSNRSTSADRIAACSESTEEENDMARNKTLGKRSSGTTLTIMQDTLATLENKIKEKENEILSLQCAIMALDNKNKEFELCMTAEMNKLRIEKSAAEQTVIDTKANNTKAMESLSEITQEKNILQKSLLEMTQDRDTLQERLHTLEQMLRDNESEFIVKLKNTESEYVSKLKDTENKWALIVQAVEQETEKKANDIQEATAELKKQYEAEWAEKAELKKQLGDVQRQLEALRDMAKHAESAEQEARKRLQEVEGTHREQLLKLKRELNDVALLSSQAALDRTRLSNEKLKLEAEVRRLETRDSERDKELANIRNTLQKQLTQAEQLKSGLELKVSALESMNAELHNRLVKLQTSSGCGSGSGESVWGAVRWGSEDENDGGVFNRSAPGRLGVGVGVGVVSSSPDLGIESDGGGGQLSSLETNNVAVTARQRPLLSTLQLTASMHNLLSAGQLDNIGHYCNIVSHCTVLAHAQLERECVELRGAVGRLQARLAHISRSQRHVEQAVCKQIHKTSVVLRQARANLDSGSDNDHPH